MSKKVQWSRSKTNDRKEFKSGLAQFSLVSSQFPTYRTKRSNCSRVYIIDLSLKTLDKKRPRLDYFSIVWTSYVVVLNLKYDEYIIVPVFMKSRPSFLKRSTDAFIYAQSKLCIRKHEPTCTFLFWIRTIHIYRHFWVPRHCKTSPKNVKSINTRDFTGIALYQTDNCWARARRTTENHTVLQKN